MRQPGVLLDPGKLCRAINLNLMLVKAIGMVTMTPARRTLDCPLLYDMKVFQI
jgi:hypothetical protein